MQTLAAPVFATVLAVMLSSARFLPMTLMLMPELRDTRHRPWKYYLAAQLLSLSGWTMAVARFPVIPRPQRLAWFYGFTLVLVTVSAASTAAGYLGADRLPPLARLALVFMVPMYYLLILTGAVRDRVAAQRACGRQRCVLDSQKDMIELWMLLAICGLATYLWRGPGVLLSAGINPHGEAFTWVSCVAYAIIAGVVSRMLLIPTGVLAETTPVERAIGSAAALAAYFWLTRRNLFIGVAAGAAALWLLKIALL